MQDVHVYRTSMCNFFILYVLENQMFVCWKNKKYTQGLDGMPQYAVHAAANLYREGTYES